MTKEKEELVEEIGSKEELEEIEEDLEQEVEEIPKEESVEKISKEDQIDEKLENWVPKTQLGKEVKAGKIKDIDEIFESGRKIMEPEIVDKLIPNLIIDTLFIGQAKGKFGGGKRRAFRQTQRKTEESNVLTFGVMAVVGDGNGHVGIGYGRAAETLPAREKAIRKAKLNLVKIRRGCASYDCSCNDPHSIPIAVSGKCSSVKIDLMPAPQGTGLVVSDEMKKIMKAAGIKDIYSKSRGKVRTTFNAAKACMEALIKIGELRL